MLKLAVTVQRIKVNEIYELEFPVNKEGGIANGKGWVIQWDKESNLKILNDFIFNNIIPQ